MDDLEKANKIREEIAKQIGFNDKGMINWARGDVDIGTYPNAIFAILEVALGREESARKIRDGIIEHIGYDLGLVRTMINPPPILEHSKRSYVIGPMPSHNTIFGLLELSIGERRNAERVKKSMEQRFPFNSQGIIGMFRSNYDDMLYDRVTEIEYEKSDTNLYRLLCYVLNGDKKEPISSVCGFSKYLELKLFESVIGREVNNDISTYLLTNKLAFSEGLIVEKESIYPYVERISTITNSLYGLLHVQDRLREIFKRTQQEEGL